MVSRDVRVRWLLACAGTLLFAATGEASASCGSAFCMVNTNWGVQGVWNEPGIRADFRLEYIDQDQPRAGTNDVAVGAIARHHDEVRTINRNVFATFDYGISDALGVSVVVPWVDREHEHVHIHRGERITESWKFSGLGDIRVIGRYQFATTPFDPQATRAGFAGITGGLKLPTGRTTLANAEGEAAERTLQPGSGTTDALLGAYYRQALGDLDASWFVQANAQLPLASHRGFRAGRQVLIDIGARYEATDRLALMLQFNAHYKGRDAGDEAEPEDSGSRTLSISPGITFAVTPAFQLYAFVQLPLHRQVNGVQLVADRSYAAGVSAQF
jgi:hypothetical protein